MYTMVYMYYREACVWWWVTLTLWWVISQSVRNGWSPSEVGHTTIFGAVYIPWWLVNLMMSSWHVIWLPVVTYSCKGKESLCDSWGGENVPWIPSVTHTHVQEILPKRFLYCGKHGCSSRGGGGRERERKWEREGTVWWEVFIYITRVAGNRAEMAVVKPNQSSSSLNKGVWYSQCLFMKTLLMCWSVYCDYQTMCLHTYTRHYEGKYSYLVQACMHAWEREER